MKKSSRRKRTFRKRGISRSDPFRLCTHSHPYVRHRGGRGPKRSLLSGNAQAQTAETEETATTSEIVVRGEAIYKRHTSSRASTTEPLRDVPQSVTVVPRALIEEQNAVSLRDVLRNVPGISMQAGEGGSGPGGDFLSVRGFQRA